MSDQDLEELYQQVIIDHYKNPRGQGPCNNADAAYDVYNPLCGDKVKVEVVTNDSIVTKICYSGEGCSISQSAASIMTEVCEGRTIEEIAELHELYKHMILEDVGSTDLKPLGDAAVLIGVKKFPARYRCALLAWQALEQALNKVNSKSVG